MQWKKKLNYGSSQGPKIISTTNKSNSPLYTTRGRGRVCSNFSPRGRFPSGRPLNSPRFQRSTSTPVTCQICTKKGHSASSCWYRQDLSYNGTTPQQQALISTTAHSTNDWVLDSGATSHITTDLNNLTTASTYTGEQQVTFGNGQQSTISHIVHGLLPTPHSKLHLNNLMYIPNLWQQLLCDFQPLWLQDTWLSHRIHTPSRTLHSRSLPDPSCCQLS